MLRVEVVEPLNQELMEQVRDLMLNLVQEEVEQQQVFQDLQQLMLEVVEVEEERHQALAAFYLEQAELVVEAEDKDLMMVVREEQLTLVVELVEEYQAQLQEFQMQVRVIMAVKEL
jgi:hypothetical protein